MLSISKQYGFFGQIYEVLIDIILFGPFFKLPVPYLMFKRFIMLWIQEKFTRCLIILQSLNKQIGMSSNAGSLGKQKV